LDFFASQELARRQSTRMVLLFLLAVLAIVAAVDLLAAAVYLSTTDRMLRVGSSLLAQVPRAVYVWTSLATLALIAGGTVFRVIALAGGGRAVAEMVGARRVDRNSQDPGERRLLNVVEEMALAAGVAVPQAYVMEEEQGINAFAAGYSPNEAVVAVTRGTLEALNRDELQGVVAHEFSHILNGDMRLNIHLLGVLNGILLIGTVGLFMLRGAGQVRGNKEGAGLVMGLFFAGAVLAAIGYIGVLFARLIKAAVSRQREFLADASAVQFTRNPEGIGGALYKIGQSTGLIANRHAEDLSHMYFGQAVVTAFGGLFDTHPPIEERIRRVLGARALLFTRSQARIAQEASQTFEETAPDAAVVAFSPGGTAAGTAVPGVEWGRRAGNGSVNTTSAAVIASVGSPTTQHVDYARQILGGLPAGLREAVGAPEGARAVLCSLLIASAGEVRDRQAAMIGAALGEAAAAQALAHAQALEPLGVRVRLPLLDLALATLKTTPQAERDRLLALIKELIEADRRVTVAEFVLITLCRRHLGGEVKGAPPVKHRTVQPVSAEIAIVLSLLVHAGRSGPEAFADAMATLGLQGQALRAPAELDFTRVEAALYELKLLAPLAKPAVIKACLAVVMADQTITVAESELMRAIGAALDTPLPPILETPPE